MCIRDRARDINAALANPDIKALMAVIGGSDQITVLPYLDPEIIRASPKAFFGYSDNTNLLNYLWSLGIASYHGGSTLVLSLIHIYPRIIKIDRSFVSPTHENIHNDTLLQTIVSLGRKLNMTVLAEGIETHGQLERLRELGCDLGQGFLFSRAVPLDDVGDIIEVGFDY